MPVQLLSSEVLLSTDQESWKALPDPFYLGPLDHLVPAFIPIAAVFVYSAKSPDSEVISVDHLRRAMQHLLDYYPQLTGRLQINKDDGTPEVTRLGTGAGFFTAQCSEALPPDVAPPATSFTLHDLPDGGNVLLPPSEPTLEATCRDPMFAVQHTRFASGGATLGVRLLHTIGDADGFFQLVRDLAELYRGLASGSLATAPPKLESPPHIRSYLSELSGGHISDDERATALKFRPALMTDEASLPTTDPSPTASTPSPPPPPPTEGRFLRFSPAELQSLKADATNPDPASSEWASTFDALSAHVYQSIHRARLQVCHENDTQLSRTDFLTPINLRSRLALPSHYFPQALLTAQATIDPEVLARGPLWRVAKAVHDLTRVAAVTSLPEIDQTIRWIAAQPDKSRIVSTFQYGTGSLMISQWNKFDMYTGSTFDGPPVLVSPPFTIISLMDGLIYFLPTVDQTGAIEVCAALSAPVWEALDRDVNFRRFKGQ